MHDPRFKINKAINKSITIKADTFSHTHDGADDDDDDDESMMMRMI